MEGQGRSHRPRTSGGFHGPPFYDFCFRSAHFVSRDYRRLAHFSFGFPLILQPAMFGAVRRYVSFPSLFGSLWFSPSPALANPPWNSTPAEVASFLSMGFRLGLSPHLLLALEWWYGNHFLSLNFPLMNRGFPFLTFRPLKTGTLPFVPLAPLFPSCDYQLEKEVDGFWLFPYRPGRSGVGLVTCRFPPSWACSESLCFFSLQFKQLFLPGRLRPFSLLADVFNTPSPFLERRSSHVSPSVHLRSGHFG